MTTTPLHPYWMGKATYHVTANSGKPDFAPILTPQIFQWSFDGTGTLNPVPGDAQGTELNQKDLSLSYDTKVLVHDLGPAVLPPEFIANDAASQAAAEQQLQDFLTAAKQFPKTTTVRAWLHKEGDPNGPLLKSEVKIHWYLPYTQIYDITGSLHLIMPDGSQFDPADLPTSPGFFDDMPDQVEEQQIQFFAKNNISPSMIADATKESTYALGKISLNTFALVATEGATATAGEAIAGFIGGLEGAGEAGAGAVEAAEIGVEAEVPGAKVVAEEVVRETGFFQKATSVVRGINASRIARGQEPITAVAKLALRRTGSYGVVNPVNVAVLGTVGALTWDAIFGGANTGGTAGQAGNSVGTVTRVAAQPQPASDLPPGEDEEELEDETQAERYYYTMTSNDVDFVPDDGVITTDAALEKGWVTGCRNKYKPPT